MAYVTGMLLIDAPASALNNAGMDDRTKVNTTKRIRTPDGDYPYVSAQSFRYWLRTTLASLPDLGWKASRVYKENENLAFSDGNPIEYWDDDLFGYMRAPSSAEGRAFGTGMAAGAAKSKKGKKADGESSDEAAATEGAKEKPTLTRISPFRVSTLVSVAPAPITTDFGAMTRHEEGNPVLHKHQFYRAHLQGLFSLDLGNTGTFYASQKVGFRNLDAIRIDHAKKLGLPVKTIRNQDAFQLPVADRQKRAATLLQGLANLEGGAKQALHYTDVAPALVVAVVAKGGNHPFNRLIVGGPGSQSLFHKAAFLEAVKTFSGDWVSPLFVGWSQGFLDDQRQEFERALEECPASIKPAEIAHPRTALLNLAEELAKDERAVWFD